MQNLLCGTILGWLKLLSIFFFFSVLGLHLWHMKVPRLGVELELQLPAYNRSPSNTRSKPHL